MKRSEGKPSYAGCKQAWRLLEQGRATSDVLGLAEETPPAGGLPLLQPVMKDGRRTDPSMPLADIRKRCRERLTELPDEVRRLQDPAPYPVRVSERLQRVTDELMASL